MTIRILGTSLLLGKINIQSFDDIRGLVDSAPVGYVDGVMSGELRGWVFDRANPTKPFSVDILDNGTVLETIECKEYRDDIRSAGYADGRCGFSFTLPLLMLDGQTHILSACFSGTQRILPNGTLLYGITQESELTKWMANIAATVKQLATAEPRLLARHEALLTIQRENMERELQVLRKLLIAYADKQEASPMAIPPLIGAAMPDTKNIGHTQPLAGN